MLLPTAQEYLLQLTRMESREGLLGTLVDACSEIRGATLWWQDDDLAIPLLTVGEGQEGTAFPLPLAQGYLLSVTPETVIPPEFLAVLGLKLAYLELQQKLNDLRPLNRVLATAAYTDTLTGLLNRRALDRDLDALEAAGTGFGVVFIDLDGFKGFNDRYGHALGDSLLRGYGVWLSRQLGVLGATYRLGGDEYVSVVTSQVLAPAEFREWARERFQDVFVDGISASIGIAWRNEHAQLSEVLRLADARMYDAKTQRKVVALTAASHSIPPTRNPVSTAACDVPLTDRELCRERQV